MKLISILLLLNILLSAQEYSLGSISIEDSNVADSKTISNEQITQQTRTIDLQEKLERDVSFTSVADGKSEKTISFRGLSFKATDYVEDLIPLYRRVSGLIDSTFYNSSSDISFNDGSAASSLGVSAMGGQVNISTKHPKSNLESTLDSTISTNDQFYTLYLGSMVDDTYAVLNTSYYKRDAFKVSENKERVNSDKEQKHISFKTGTYINDNLHIATKLAYSKAVYGNPVNTDTLNQPFSVWNAYTRIDPKEMASVYFYLDYDDDYFDINFRAYYDEYKDIYKIYDDITYTSHGDIVTYNDARLGSLFKSTLKQQDHKVDFVALFEQNEHLRSGGSMPNSTTIQNTIKLSLMDDYAINNSLKLQSALSYNALKEVRADDKVLTNTSKQNDTYDGQIKLSYKQNKNSYFLGIAKKSRMPSMDEMFPLFAPDVNQTSYDVDPEQSLQYTAAYSYNFSKITRLDFSLYYYDTNDLIVSNGDNTYSNLDHAEQYGAEFRYKTKFYDSNAIELSYSYAHTQDSQGDAIVLIPNHQFLIQDSINIYKNYNAFISYQYVGSRYSQNSATYTDEKHKLDPYHLLDAQIYYDYSKHIKARIGIKNILAEEYEWTYGYPAEGRSYYATLNLKI